MARLDLQATAATAETLSAANVSGDPDRNRSARVVRLHPGAVRLPQRHAAAQQRRPLGQLLIADGAVKPGDLLKAVVIQRRENVGLAEILLGNGWVTEAALARALARQWRAGVVDLATSPPDPRLIDAMGAPLCLAEAAVPWRRIGGVTFIATARPEAFEALLPRLPARLGQVRMLMASEREILDAILATRRTALIRQAELCVPEAMSCRTRDEVRTGHIALAVMAALAIGLLLVPLASLTAITAVAAVLLALGTGLRVLALRSWLAGRRAAQVQQAAFASGAEATPQMRDALPVITVMVPMFREADIAPRLIARVASLTYPRELTDILLVVEEGDSLTRDALAEAALPRWMRVVVVPKGRVQTKPRALNYAMNYARGSIVGIWDAEDMPDPDQLHKVARRFAEAPAEVACLQGILDFYAPKTNWLSRCFTIEYGNWFRVILPGMARMGLIVPLGGTTLFLRRAAIERVGGWDAWNVTEDADLGMRLARFGLRTEMIDSVTQEEPNCRARSWVKQRSRWHKGYFMTWAVHMRDPVQLWRDIGTKAFVGFQLQMFGTVAGFLLAPMLWSFWILSTGGTHPLQGVQAGLVGGWLMAGLLALFIAAEVVNIVIGLIANGTAGRRHLMPFVPTTWLYFPLATLAAWKAIYEVVVDPFTWDKTAHGLVHAPDAVPQALPGHAVLPEVFAPIPIAGVGKRVQVAVLGQIG